MKLLVNLIHITCNKRQECVLLASPHICNFYKYFNRIANIQSHCVSITICKTCRREKYDLFWMMNSWCLIYNFTDLEPIKCSPPYNDTVNTSFLLIELKRKIKEESLHDNTTYPLQITIDYRRQVALFKEFLQLQTI